MAVKHLDAKTQICPKAMILVMSTIKTLDKGDSLTVETTDVSTKESIPKLCERAGFALLEMDEKEGVITFSIQK